MVTWEKFLFKKNVIHFFENFNLSGNLELWHFYINELLIFLQSGDLQCLSLHFAYKQGFGAALFWDGSGSGNLQPGAGSGSW